MTFTLGFILKVLVNHWFADFVLQTDKQAKGKSKNWKDLLSHTFLYSIHMFISSLFWLSLWDALLFFAATFIFHTITDYFTSRLNSKLWAEGRVHLFFVSVGFDQFLHYAQLFGTLYLLQS